MPCSNRIRLAVRRLSLALAALTLCSALFSQKVEVSQDPAVDWPALKTFVFENKARSLTDPFYEHPQAEQWVQDALREGLSELGYEESDSQDSDFRIRISGQTRLREREVDTGRVYIKHVEQFIEATLKVEFVQAGSQEAFWASAASDRAYVKRKGVDITPKKARQKIHKAVGKMMRRLGEASGFRRQSSGPQPDRR